MIILNEEIGYYILIDGQGGDFASGVIFEGIVEVAEAFQEWAKCDGYEDPTLKGMSISDCLNNWTLTLKQYVDKDFIEVEIDYIL